LDGLCVPAHRSRHRRRRASAAGPAGPRVPPARPTRNARRGPVRCRPVDFDLSPEQELVRETVRRFASERVAPIAAELDRAKRFPYDLVAELAELGLMGMTIPAEYGGAGADTVSYAIAIEELARVDSSVAITVAAHHSLGTLPIYQFGSDEQKRK